MLELLLCFGAGVATSSWLRRRARRRSELPDRAHPVSQASIKQEFTGSQCAAILVMTLPPETSAQIFNELSGQMVQLITLEIPKLPKTSPDTRLHIVRKFCQSLGIPENLESFEEASKAEPKLVSKAIAILADPQPGPRL